MNLKQKQEMLEIHVASLKLDSFSVSLDLAYDYLHLATIMEAAGRTHDAVKYNKLADAVGCVVLDVQNSLDVTTVTITAA